MFGIVLQVAIAWAYSHVLEYCLHRWLLHNRKRKQWFRNHFGDHHRTARKNMMLDSKALDSLSIKDDPEIKGLIVLALLHVPVVILYPFCLCIFGNRCMHLFLRTPKITSGLSVGQKLPSVAL